MISLLDFEIPARRYNPRWKTFRREIFNYIFFLREAFCEGQEQEQEQDKNLFLKSAFEFLFVIIK
jgi:hypothetical protein